MKTFSSPQTSKSHLLRSSPGCLKSSVKGWERSGWEIKNVVGEYSAGKRRRGNSVCFRDPCQMGQRCVAQPQNQDHSAPHPFQQLWCSWPWCQRHPMSRLSLGQCCHARRQENPKILQLPCDQLPIGHTSWTITITTSTTDMYIKILRCEPRIFTALHKLSWWIQMQHMQSTLIKPGVGSCWATSLQSKDDQRFN